MTNVLERSPDALRSRAFNLSAADTFFREDDRRVVTPVYKLTLTPGDDDDDDRLGESSSKVLNDSEIYSAISIDILFYGQLKIRDDTSPYLRNGNLITKNTRGARQQLDTKHRFTCEKFTE